MMLEPERLVTIRRALRFSQDDMARLLGVSYASVNRWENGHSGPIGTVLQVYRALDAALRRGKTPEQILGERSGEAGLTLHRIFHSAYGERR